MIYFRFNWGSRMQKLSNEILKLLQGGESLNEARLKALKITNEIQGFGSSVNSNSPSSILSASPLSSEFASPAGSSSSSSFSPTSNDSDNKYIVPQNDLDESHLWDGSTAEEILIDSEDDDEMGKPKGFVSEMCSKIIAGSSAIGSREKIEFRCLSDVGRRATKKRYGRQNSLWF